MGHVKQRSLSAPIAMPAEFKAGSEEHTARMGTWPFQLNGPGSGLGGYEIGVLGDGPPSASASASAPTSMVGMIPATEITTPPYILSTEYMVDL